MAPAATFATVGEIRTDRWRGRITPVTPAPSALRRSEPRLCGSVRPSQTSRKGWTESSGTMSSSSATGLSERARARTPWCDSVSAMRSSRALGSTSSGM